MQDLLEFTMRLILLPIWIIIAIIWIIIMVFTGRNCLEDEDLFN
ncbi:hypothetical protein [Spiroplasma endosymbiont of Amphimallon solstitiale]